MKFLGSIVEGDGWIGKIYKLDKGKFDLSTLQSIDLNWKSHIQYLEQLRQVIGLRSYGQRDPLIEYKKEAFVLFENLLDKLKLDFITILINLTVTKKISNDEKEIKQPSKIDPKYIGKKMSRNEPCFCGSGKKFKKCCGAL